ncbi:MULTISPECIES: DUF1839 family protein [unclassified Rhodococcus (in: high G+C Gram-positive bacteria)]|jgi:hypothetical protein|uniref:DUF1839 family protein n=1 Tax=unclassified Rhodococcus (in: high G+C Gram-positive bacteria) TaxID=192944 RepID=UPI0021BF7782|nr:MULTISPECIES: DUF1839 family protein [unclassified Rhodococcus (in: high G+C Gram-positive bacteria)]MDQ1181928.1 hypothetical protein [Rhodococcus sp. SORGH_AS_0301]MDQ1203267.1 hypothetical protein [Rhodococcus sp. SORGH_AS_0303]
MTGTTTPSSMSASLGADAAQHVPHPVHRGDRIWSQTNCYVDLWIELVHALKADPIPAMAVVLSTDFDGRQWDFVKFQPEDMRALLGIRIDEMNVWKPFWQHIVENLEDGVLCTVEVDSYFLPDTDGINYHIESSKTTIVPVVVDTDVERMEYFHNSGYHVVQGEDFRRVLSLDAPVPLPPYIERIGIDRDRLALGATHDDIDLAVARSHVARRPRRNPVAALGDRVQADIPWIQQAGPEQFHLWSFGTLRQCGFTAELGADLARYLESRGVAGSDAAVAPFLDVATGAKSVQFKMARAARGRAVDVTGALHEMAQSWQYATDTLASALHA